MYLKQFGSYVIPRHLGYVYNEQETQGAGRRPDHVELPGVGGAIDNYGAGANPLAQDTIGYTFVFATLPENAILLQTLLDDFKGQMMEAPEDSATNERLLIAELPDGSLRFTLAKCDEVRLSAQYFNQNHAWQDVASTFSRVWPAWFAFEDGISLGEHLGTLADVAAATYTLGGNVQSSTITTTDHTFTVSNGGRLVTTEGIIELAGEITNPVIKNLRNSYQITWTGSLGASDRLTIDLGSRLVRKNGVNEYPNITIGTENGQVLPMVLWPGDNDLQITSDSVNNCVAKIYLLRQFA